MIDMNDSFLKLNDLIKIVTEKYTKIVDDRSSIQGITPSQAQIMLFLDQNGAYKVSQIAHALHMPDSNVSNICSRLEKSGYINRERQKDDNRVVKIKLTEAAFPKIESIRAVAAHFHKKMQEFVSLEDVEDICAGLSKLNHLLDMFLETANCTGLK